MATSKYQETLDYMFDDLFDNVDHDELKTAKAEWTEFQAEFLKKFDKAIEQIEEQEAEEAANEDADPMDE